MFGRNPRLPIDVTLGLHVEEQQPSSKCISDLKDRLSQDNHLATEAAQKAREKQKEGYDIRIRGAAIKQGDRVLVKVVSFCIVDIYILYLDFFNQLVILTLIVYGQSGGKHHNTPTN
jgi:hypothetical protein